MIHGIPCMADENLRTIFNSLCFALNITPTPRPLDIFRVRPGKAASSIVDPAILIKLKHLGDKAKILEAIGQHRRDKKPQPNLQMLGFDSEALFYVNEQLTRENYELFRKKHKQLTAVACKSLLELCRDISHNVSASM